MNVIVYNNTRCGASKSKSCLLRAIGFWAKSQQFSVRRNQT